jgi:hypothetical protein
LSVEEGKHYLAATSWAGAESALVSPATVAALPDHGGRCLLLYKLE